VVPLDDTLVKPSDRPIPVVRRPRRSPSPSRPSRESPATSAWPTWWPAGWSPRTPTPAPPGPAGQHAQHRGRDHRRVGSQSRPLAAPLPRREGHAVELPEPAVV